MGQGAQFLALEWVLRALERHLGLTPFPGTLNLRIVPEVRNSLFERREQFLRISDPASPDLPGYLQKLSLRANERTCDAAWLILPEKTMYNDVLEIISAVRLRHALSLNDGDSVEMEIELV